MCRPSNNSHGFTLVELMIVVLISGIIVAAIYSAYISQQRVYVEQEQVAEMQQNIRAATDIMAREIKTAGYDPQHVDKPGVTTANTVRFGFTRDVTNTAGTAPDGDGLLDGPNENITFGFSNADDADNDGVADAGAASLGRNTGGGFQAIANNIQAIEFYYTMADGTQTTGPVALAQLADIRTVQISILARADKNDINFTNSLVYCPASNPLDPVTGLCTNPAPASIWGPYTDNFRRRLLITTVHCRNMGI